MDRRSAVLWAATLGCAVGTGACDKVLGITQKVMTDAGEQGFDVTVAVSRLRVVRGQSASVDVTIQRRGGFDGVVTVYVNGQPSGVQVDPLVIPVDQSAGTLNFAALASVGLGLATLSVLATSGSTGADPVPLQLIVQDAPSSRDLTFGGGTGRVVIPIQGGLGVGPGGVKIAPDGSIVVCGWAGTGPADSAIAVARLAPAGALDPSFGGAGIALARVSGSSADACESMFLRAGGGINLAGFATPTGTGATGARAMMVGRFTPAGLADQNTGVGGFVTTPFGATDSLATALLSSDGDAYLAGGIGSGQPTVARYQKYGQLDPNFGSAGTGIVTLALAGGAVRWLAQQSSGNLVAAVDSSPFRVVRLTPAGELDATFGSGGAASVDIGGSGSSAAVVLARPAGTAAADALVVVGTAVNPAGMRDVAVAGLTPSGTLDATFGADGWSMAHFGDGDSVVSSAVLDDVGSVVVAGQTPSPTGPVFTVIRFTAAGILDPTFGTGGRSTFGVGQAQATCVDDLGRIVVAGFAQPSDASPGIVVYRLWP